MSDKSGSAVLVEMSTSSAYGSPLLTPPSNEAVPTRHVRVGTLPYLLLIPEPVAALVTELNERFVKEHPALPIDLDDEDDQDELVQGRELETLAAFMGYVAARPNKVLSNESSVRLILKTLIEEVEKKFLCRRDVHVVVASLHLERSIGSSVIKAYYASFHRIGRALPSHDSQLLTQGKEGKAMIYTVFGGQGTAPNYLDELRELNGIYGDFSRQMIETLSHFLDDLAEKPSTLGVYSKGLNVYQWICDPTTEPAPEYLQSAPVSFPLIGLTQLVHYHVACNVLQITPGQFLASMTGATGHSQGIITAAAISVSDSWASFDERAKEALAILFWIGVRSQQTLQLTPLPDRILRDFAENQETPPTPMMRISGLSLARVQEFIRTINSHLPTDGHIHIALLNGPRTYVVAGPPLSLYGLLLKLRSLRSKTQNISRIPFSQREDQFQAQFLQMTSPFHGPFLSSATDVICEDLKGLRISPTELRIPVYHTFDGRDIREDNISDLVRTLVKMVTEDPVHWEAATRFPGATHILDFGPEGTSGIGVLTHRNKEGTGVRTVLCGVLGDALGDFGYKSELYDRWSGVRYSKKWAETFQPKLARTPNGRVMVDTKLTRLLGLPPLMVAGMTPTTVDVNFFSSTFNSRYHIELATGGYHSASALTTALKDIERLIYPGRGITLNLIYLSPHAIAWQIPLIRKLISEGFPIDGLTIGAGVPSADVAKDFITTLGLRHIAFKPGSVAAIREVVALARQHPEFPIMLQWTGGRGGGHHSCEDFHQPILETYSEIRSCNNIVLVAGSGFGGSEDSFPYLSGSWATYYSRPIMPFDGILFGSRMMIAREAKTSRPAKEAIVELEGVDDAHWEKSFSGSAGGVITVKSEMGEPIHKIATRGVKLWSELDKDIFCLDKGKQLLRLEEKRDYIIKRLNKDYQRVWFGKSANLAVEIADMTYHQVLERLTELMYVSNQSRWVDPSWRSIVFEFLQTVEARFVSSKYGTKTSVLQNELQLETNPRGLIKEFVDAYPMSKDLAIAPQDVQYLIMRCRRPKTKPVPFILTLDETFETCFKKDSLWQSEDVDSVVDRDIQRTCILHGPVAAKHSRVVDEPIKVIMDNIHDALVARLLQEVYLLDETSVPDYLPMEAAVSVIEPFYQRLAIPLGDGEITCYDSASKTNCAVNRSHWFEMLGGELTSWRRAIFTSDSVAIGTRLAKNPIRSIFSPVPGLEVQMHFTGTSQSSIISLYDRLHPSHEPRKLAQLSCEDGKTIILLLFEPGTGFGHAIDLRFKYDAENLCIPIHEVLECKSSRVKKFYSNIWLPRSAENSCIRTNESQIVTADSIKSFTQVVRNASPLNFSNGKNTVQAPMDFAMVLGWNSIMECLVQGTSADCDFLKLVHLSNTFNFAQPSQVIQEGDHITDFSKVTAIITKDAGKMVQVTCTLCRHESPILTIQSEFLFRGVFTDFGDNMETRDELPMKLQLVNDEDVAVLRSRPWYHSTSSDALRAGSNLIFKLRSIYSFKGKGLLNSVKTTGAIMLETSRRETKKIAEVIYEAKEGLRNPVMEYLERKGSPFQPRIIFSAPVTLTKTRSPVFKTPESNQPYALVSSDFNPIHVSRIFAEYAGLPGPITHGMFTSAATRAVVDDIVGNNHAGGMKQWSCKFVGMVQPNDKLEVAIQHIGMISGRMIIQVKVVKVETQEIVLTGEAEVEQPPTAYVFTGQGSQFKGMGMDLYKTSAVARVVWDQADDYFTKTYGFALTTIVRENPRELTVYFGGVDGEKIRQNYLNLEYEHPQSHGPIEVKKIFADLNENSMSYTWKSPEGLLSATQFTQVALVFMEKAHFEDMRHNGLIQENAIFAGHSLGEYSALTALAEVMQPETLAACVFYRGLIMQTAVQRDDVGRSDYGMCAVDPSRVSKGFNEQSLAQVLQAICSMTGWLLEIVNFNIPNSQYVCAGELKGLDCLTNVLNTLGRSYTSIHTSSSEFTETIIRSIAATKAKSNPITLVRGKATIPLPGIDVPFHSTLLLCGVDPFRKLLKQKMKVEDVHVGMLVGKYIPNLTGRPFELTRDYVSNVMRITGSQILKEVIQKYPWREHESANSGAKVITLAD